MRRLVLTADLSLDGFVGGDGLDPDWPREYDDEHLLRYRQRVLQKAGILVTADWSLDALAEREADGGAEELAPIVAHGDAGFLQELTRRHLVDEYRLTVHPVVFGDGHRLFGAADRLLNISTRHFAQGSVAYTLVPVGKYRDHPPPLPWALSGSERPGEHDDDPETDDPAEGPTPG